MSYTAKYHVIYFLSFVFETWMWVCALADLVTLEEEYPAPVVFNHLLISILCIITRKLYLRSWYCFQKKILKVSPFIMCQNKCGSQLAWIPHGFSRFCRSLTFWLYFQPNWSNPPVVTMNTIAIIPNLRISMDLKTYNLTTYLFNHVDWNPWSNPWSLC